MRMDHTDENSSFLSAYRIHPSVPSVTERYFKIKTIPDYNQCILTHSNRLCLVTIASSHPILSGSTEIESINFVGKHNRLNNKVSGKFKRGGQKLSEKSVICMVKTSDGKEHTIYSCISGTLVEINEKLLKEPNLLKNKPWSEGYIGIILPPFSSAQKTVSKDVSD